MLIWCLISWAIVGGAILSGGPLRDGVLGELVESPRFAVELGLGFAAGLAAIWAGLELGVPGGPSAGRLWSPPAILSSAWILVVGYGLLDPSTPPGMNGKRADCFIQILQTALPSLALAIYLLRDRIAFSQSAAGLLVGSAAAAIPVLWMHIACQSGSGHVLTHHFPSILVVGGLGALLARRLLARA